MSFKALLDRWQVDPAPPLADERYSIRLPVDDAARIAALAELFPEIPAERIIADLLHAGLEEVEAAMPYEAGERVIREDEFGDPVYEDVGMTPRFVELVRQKRAALKHG